MISLNEQAHRRYRFKYLGRTTASQHLECSYPAALSTCLFGSTMSFCIIPFDSLEFYYLDHVTNSCVRPRPAGDQEISWGAVQSPPQNLRALMHAAASNASSRSRKIDRAMHSRAKHGEETPAYVIILLL